MMKSSHGGPRICIACSLKPTALGLELRTCENSFEQSYHKIRCPLKRGLVVDSLTMDQQLILWLKSLF
jgi:hypothetical protein